MKKTKAKQKIAFVFSEQINSFNDFSSFNLNIYSSSLQFTIKKNIKANDKNEIIGTKLFLIVLKIYNLIKLLRYFWLNSLFLKNQYLFFEF